MGYIYLITEDYSEQWESKTNIYIFKEKGVYIPLYKDNNILSRLDSLKIVDKIFWSALDDNDIFLQYHCDRKDNFISGIELKLPVTYFMKRVREQVYRIYQINWQNKNFNLVLLDREKKVFAQNSLVYPLTEEKDVFIIVSQEDHSASSITALISSNNDIYPLAYMLTPQFLV
ncbi:MAG: hypothetical protein ACLFMO_07565 [Eubacteriales bacterium]